MYSTYWLLNLFYELLQRTLNQNKVNLQNVQKFSLPKMLELNPVLILQTSVNLFCSWNTLILHWNFWEKPLHFTFYLLLKHIRLIFYSSSNRNGFNPYNVSRVDLQDHFSSIAPWFAPNWFADAFIAFLSFSCYILSQCWFFNQLFCFWNVSLVSHWFFISL